MVKKKKTKGQTSGTSIDKALIENFVSLQKVMVNLSVKFDNLTTQISKLLDLFEISAKALAEKDFASGKESKETKKILDKVDIMLEQNKIIARGLTLLHEPQASEQALRPPMPPQQQIRQPMQTPVASLDVEKYQKSISSTTQKLPR